MELQLITHGMMLFWYRHPVPRNRPETDGYRIFIPQGTHNRHMVHELRLGLSAGAIDSVLSYNDQHGDPATQYWRLEFENIPTTRDRGAKLVRSHLGFYLNSHHRPVPRFGIDKASSGIAFVIDIPYPRLEEPIRFNTYGASPYNPGRVTAAFGLHENRRILSARVLSFEVGDQPIVLLNTTTGETRMIMDAPLPDRVKLHLYSQPPCPTKEGHIEILNAMLALETRAGGGVMDAFDLEVNDRNNSKPNPPMSPPLGLDEEDLKHLSELNENDPAKCPRDPEHVADMLEEIFAFDPAECGQGGGCDHDPCEGHPPEECV